MTDREHKADFEDTKDIWQLMGEVWGCIVSALEEIDCVIMNCTFATFIVNFGVK